MDKKLFSNQACIATFESALAFAERNPGGFTYVAPLSSTILTGSITAFIRTLRKTSAGL